MEDIIVISAFCFNNRVLNDWTDCLSVYAPGSKEYCENHRCN